MVGAVFGQAVLERLADARFVVGTAELDDVFQFLVVALYVGVGWHGEILSLGRRRASPAKPLLISPWKGEG